jgi:adenosylhomocysteine nucleosidase
VCALAAEARHVLRSGAAATTAICDGPGHSTTPAINRLGDGTLLMVSGMGGPAAAAAARALVDAGATALMSFGLAGGLDPRLSPGSLFLPSAVLANDALAPAVTDAAWRDGLSASLAALRPHAQGTLLTSERAIASVGAKAALFRITAAAAVDMEGFAVAGVALQRQIPFVALKVIVDGAHDALPGCALAATDAGGRVHLGRLLRALVRSPSELAPLFTLALRYRTASQMLAAAAKVLAMPAPAPS